MRIVIVGAGVGGIAAAIELRCHGFEDITVLERGPELGGTWHWNTYPGCACDVPSHLYSFSFAQRRDWSRLCSPQDEIRRYLHEVADEFGVTPLVRTGVNVTTCAFSDATAEWTLCAQDGREFIADAVILATGQLHQPAVPRLAGEEQFAGHRFHSAAWDHDYDLDGKQVAVIGTGASAVQFVPEIVDRVGRLHVFQRTGNWFMPRRNRPYPAPYHWLIEHAPALQAFRRGFWMRYGEFLTLMIRHPRTWGRVGALVSRLFMLSQLRDPEVRRRAWPDYTFGCKRVLFSSQFLPALQAPNAELITEPITSLTQRGILTADGTERQVDCIIYGTGFRTTEFMFPMEAEGPHAHLGISVPGFPSLFLVYGPNTNTSGGSIIFYEETQVAYIRQAIEHVVRSGAAAIDVRPEVEAASDQALQARFVGTAWTACDSWYRTADGRIVTNWPGYMSEYGDRLRRLEPGEFRLVPAPERAPDAAPQPVAV
jgi:cation diffusion facilitator CzcD-associated flavoprotein CzcO